MRYTRKIYFGQTLKFFEKVWAFQVTYLPEPRARIYLLLKCRFPARMSETKILFDYFISVVDYKKVENIRKMPFNENDANFCKFVST